MVDIANAISVLFLFKSMVEKTVKLKQPEASRLIRELRQLTGLSQEQFAQMLGVAFSTVNRWENGHIQPSRLALRQIKTILSNLEDSATIELRQESRALLDQYFAEAAPHIP